MISASAAASANNKLAVFHNQKFKKASAEEKEAMIVGAPFGEPLPPMLSAQDAYDSVLADVGATLPARDAVDLRIVQSVREGRGGMIQKETDLPESQRWPDYRSLPAPVDTDKDGIPDFWETQFGLDPQDHKDSALIAAGGYANIEHYFNGTDPRGGTAPLISVSATISRAYPAQGGAWLITRSGPSQAPLTVHYTVSGDAVSARDFEPLTGSVTIPAGKSSAPISLQPLAGTQDNKTVIMTLAPNDPACRVGCPSSSLIVLRRNL